MSEPNGSKRGPATTIDLVAAITRLVTILGILTLLLYYRNALVDRIVPNLAKIDLGPVSFDLSRQQEETAKSSRMAGLGTRDLLLPRPDIVRLSARAARDSAVVVGRRILWLDDKHPTMNAFNRLLLNSLGSFVDPVATTAEADTLLRLTCYDLLIVDGRRYPDSLVHQRRERADSLLREPKGGVDFARRVIQSGKRIPVIVYAQHLPPGLPYDSLVDSLGLIAGLARTPAQLGDMVLDQLERHPAPACGRQRRAGLHD